MAGSPDRTGGGDVADDAMRLQVVVDSTEPHVLADWWAATLGWEVEHQDESFIRQMIEDGHATEADTTVHDGQLRWAEAVAVVAGEPVPGTVRLLFQRVPEAKQVKNRVHLDLRPGPDADLAAVRATLESRGATPVGEGQQGPHTWVVFADPEGNEFCI